MYILNYLAYYTNILLDLCVYISYYIIAKTFSLYKNSLISHNTKNTTVLCPSPNFFFFFGKNQSKVSNGSKCALEFLETIISEADHMRAASVKLEPNFEEETSLQSAKYFPLTFASLG